MTRSMDAPVRMGVVGAGSLGFHHVRILRDLPEVRLIGFHDADPARSAFVAGELGVSAFPSVEALLDRVDAVVIAVPTREHATVGIQALSRGIHALIEKPIARSIAEADAILAAARSGTALVQTGHVERFNAAITAAEPFLERPLFIESHRLAPFTARGTDVAVVLDLMIHDVDLVQGLVGRPVRSLEAHGVPILTPSVDIANARIAFDGGAVANLTASRVSTERMRKLRIFQPSGYLSLNLAEGRGEFLRLRTGLEGLVAGGGLPETPGGILDIVERIPLMAEPVEPLRRELESFRDAVMGRIPPVVTGEQGRAALATALEIQSRIDRNVAHSRPA